ncbi:MAG: Smr/MutS family protein [Anaerolineae bacterium]|nr:Smr/MutS family protein [Anaerolineae bacterium]
MGKIDLHGMTVKEALDTFTAYYNAQLARNDRSEIEVVHGYGSSGEGGEIRKRLRRLLEGHPARVEFRAAERFSTNPGATYVKPILPLPTAADQLQSEILAYCENARTESKVIGKFRRYGDKQVKDALQSLVKEGLLRRFPKGAYIHYEQV